MPTSLLVCVDIAELGIGKEAEGKGRKGTRRGRGKMGLVVWDVQQQIREGFREGEGGGGKQ